VYLLVPVHNRRELTVRFAEALRAQTRRDFQLVLIDDGSTDGTAAAVTAVLPDAVVIRGSGEWWWAGCLDQGCRWLRRQAVPAGTMVGLMNDDVGIEPEFLEQITEELARHPDTLLLARSLDAAGRLLDEGGGVRADLRRLTFVPTSDPGAVNCLPTRGLFLRWGVLERAGGFRPGALPHYLSDYEFTHRAWRRGLKLRVAATASVRLHEGTAGWTRDDLWRRKRAARVAAVFSPRFKDNPRAWIAFAWFTAPMPWRLLLPLRIAASTLLLLGRCLVQPVRTGTSAPVAEVGEASR
jgi:GT2 family glycosyltransferase